jgi:sugar phosphate isomerase/epimerase
MELSAQLIVFGKDLMTNLEGNLSIVREAGFHAVEGGPMLLDARPAAELRKVLAGAGLRLSAIHCDTGTVDSISDFINLCTRVAELGCTDVICSGVIEGGDTRRHYERTGEVVDRGARTAADKGVRLSYHHHDWELARILGKHRGIEVLMERAGPQAGFVIDTYWSLAGGRDWRWLWERYGTRCWTIHLKDGLPGRHRFSALGEGSARVAEAFHYFEDKGLRYVTWEQDLARDTTIEDAVTISGRWLTERVKPDAT